MYYELYLDVFFLENFVMDYLLLLLVRRMLKCTATHKNIFFGALLGAFLTCFVMILPITYVFIKFILFHMFVNTCMIRAGLKIKTRTEFARAYLLLYAGSFLLGGILEAVQSYVKVGSLFFTIAIVGYFTISGLWEFLLRMQKITVCQCEVELMFREKSICVKGIIDTGNGLCDPITGAPVHILNRKKAMTLLAEVPADKIRYVPYHSIGKQKGILAAVHADLMHVRGKEEYWCEKPLIGISEETVSSEGDYEMILNPKAF